MPEPMFSATPDSADSVVQMMRLVRQGLEIFSDITREGTSWTYVDRGETIKITDPRAAEMIRLAHAYDESTHVLLDLTSVDYVKRMDIDGYHPEEFREAAALVVTLEKLEAQVAEAKRLADQIRAKVGSLHDKNAREAVAALRTLDSQLRLIQESLEKQQRRYDQLHGHCVKSVTHREAETQRARNAAADRVVISEVEETMDLIRSLASQSADIVKNSRMKPGTRESLDD